MPTYTYVCLECDHVTDHNCPYVERPEFVECSICGKQAEYKLGAPLVMRASYHDGVKRRGYQDMREASKLNRQKAQTTGQARKEIEKEIRKMRVKVE